MLVRFFFFLLLLCSCSCFAEQKRYVVEARIAENHYISELLLLILEASKAPDEVIDLRYNRLYDLHLTQTRRIAEFSRQKANAVMWTVTSKEREDFLRAIRVPIYKGLFGYRCLVIRKEDQEKFAQIKTRAQLAKLMAGQGEQWPDTNVLRANDFPVMTGGLVKSLYQMLAAKRFDYFPRGLVEVEPELDLIKKYNLMIEPNLVLQYPNPLYFFVQKDNIELAGRLERGWKIILSNGSFDKLFYRQERVKKALNEVIVHPKYIARMHAPEFPEGSPMDSSQYFHSQFEVENLPQ
ncbi:MAG TPA: hypothetical protein VN030_12025 [Cellvibrio sp.]|nr:hypothetical protein [Cellvibrio sp.]